MRARLTRQPPGPRRGLPPASREAYAAAEVPAEVQPFFNDVPDRIAGALWSSAARAPRPLADITVIGRPAILIPFAAATEDHQTANAQAACRGRAAP